MSVGRDAKAEFFAAWLILVLALSFYAVSGVNTSPKVEWTQVSNPSIGGDAAWGVAVDASGIYVVGYDNLADPDDVEWRIEKRNLTDGKLIWNQTNNPSIDWDQAWSVAVDVSGIYVVGYDSSPGNPEWRIEKRSLTDGKLIWDQVSNPSPNQDSAFGVAVDASGIYVVGIDNSPGHGDFQWRMEKRNLTDGKLIWNQVSNPSAGEDWAFGVAVDVSGIYVVGYDSSPGNPEWRIEKRSLTDGKLIWTQTNNPTQGEESGIYLGDKSFGVCVDVSGIYVVGFDNFAGPDDIELRIEKRSLTDGSLIWNQTNNPSPYEDRAFGVAVDASGIYVVGFDSSPGHGDLEWRIEKRRVADGSLLWTLTSNPSAGEDWAWGVAVDASGIYVVGFDSSLDMINIQWRIEKISAEAATPFYTQTWFIIVSMAVSVVIILFAVVIIMYREKRRRGIVRVTSPLCWGQVSPSALQF